MPARLQRMQPKRNRFPQLSEIYSGFDGSILIRNKFQGSTMKAKQLSTRRQRQIQVGFISVPLLLVSLWFLAPRLMGQQESTPTFSADVKVVNVLATVRNKRGEI